MKDIIFKIFAVVFLCACGAFQIYHGFNVDDWWFIGVGIFLILMTLGTGLIWLSQYRRR